jgi:hypothetical protein
LSSNFFVQDHVASKYALTHPHPALPKWEGDGEGGRRRFAVLCGRPRGAR